MKQKLNLNKESLNILKLIGLITCLILLSACNPVMFGEQSEELSSLASTASDNSVPVAQPPPVCLFNGKTYQNGSSIKTYAKNLLPYDGDCEAKDNVEYRICKEGILTGSFTEETCHLEPQKVGVLDPNWKTETYNLPTASHLIIEPDESLLLVGNTSLFAGENLTCSFPTCSAYMTAYKFNLLDGQNSFSPNKKMIYAGSAKYYASSSGGTAITYFDSMNTGMIPQAIMRNANSYTFFGAFGDGLTTWGPQVFKSNFSLDGKAEYSSAQTLFYPSLGGNTWNGTSFSEIDLLSSHSGFLMVGANSIKKVLFTTAVLDPTFGVMGELRGKETILDVKTSAEDDSFIKIINTKNKTLNDTYGFLKYDNLGHIEKASVSWTMPSEFNTTYGGNKYFGSIYNNDGSVILIFSVNKKETTGNQIPGYVLVKFNSEGLLDKTYGDLNGFAWIPLLNPKVSIPYFKIQSLRFISQKNGQIYIVGNGFADEGNFGTSVVRINANGTHDKKSFGAPKDGGILKVRGLSVPDRSLRVKVEDAGLVLSPDEKYLYIAFKTITRRVILK